MTPICTDRRDRVSGDLYGFIRRNNARSIRVMLTCLHSLTSDRHKPIMHMGVVYSTNTDLYYDGKTAEQSLR